MTDPVPEYRRPWFAVLALAACLLVLLAVRPGLLGDDTDRAYKSVTTLGMVAAVASVAWRFHGIVAAAAVAVLFLAADRPPHADVALAERGADAALVGLLALAVGGNARPDRQPLTWVLMAGGVAALVAVGVCQWGLNAPEDPTARARTGQLVVALAGLTAAISLLGRAPAATRFKELTVWIAVPAAVIGGWRMATGCWPLTWDAAAWPALADEWKSDGWAQAAWCWTTPWAAAPLLAVGLWRTAARGRKQRRAGQAPVGWLVGFLGLAAVVALTPRPVGRDSLALAAVGALLSVFAVADLGLAMIERIELKPPPPGPSDIPRVR